MLADDQGCISASSTSHLGCRIALPCWHWLGRLSTLHILATRSGSSKWSIFDASVQERLESSLSSVLKYNSIILCWCIMDSATAMPLFVSTGIFHGFFITRCFRSSLPKISIVVGNRTLNLLANVDTEAESFDSLRRYIACKYATSDLLKSESFNCCSLKKWHGFQLNQNVT